MAFWDVYVYECERVGKKPNPVASEIGISSGTVTKWKNGATPKGAILKRVADYFGVTTDYLLMGSESDGTEQSPAVDDDGGRWAEFAKVYRQLSPEQQALLFGTAKEMRRKQ